MFLLYGIIREHSEADREYHPADKSSPEVEQMIDHGIKILKVSDDQVEQFKSLSTRAMQNMRGAKFSPQTLIELKSHLKRYRQEKK